MLSKDWQEFCRVNEYDFGSLVTINNNTFLSIDKITGNWVLGTVVISDKGINTINSLEPMFYTDMNKALEAFTLLMAA